MFQLLLQYSQDVQDDCRASLDGQLLNLWGALAHFEVDVAQSLEAAQVVEWVDSKAGQESIRYDVKKLETAEAVLEQADGFLDEVAATEDDILAESQLVLSGNDRD